MKTGFSIGKLRINSPLVLAPLDGVNCATFRMMCHSEGAGLVSSPMIPIDDICEKRLKILNFQKKERPLSIQLVGSKTEKIKNAISLIEPFADVIDVNLGCPEKDILGKKAGAFFSKHPEQIHKILSPIISATNLPVTAKIRTGWDEKSINTLDQLRILEDLGVSAITIHARTKSQKYAGKADWSQIKLAKEHAKIPIIGNGDVFKPGTAKAMFEQTGCDGVMIGRGAIGKPSIFMMCNHLLNKGTSPSQLNSEEQLSQAKEFLKLYCKIDKNRSFTEAKQHILWFLKGQKEFSYLRDKLAKSSDFKNLSDTLLSATIKRNEKYSSGNEKQFDIHRHSRSVKKRVPNLEGRKRTWH